VPTKQARDFNNVKAASTYMRRALALAARAVGDTSPNPLVGAVVVVNEKIVGEGYHRRAGAPHAEREALRAAGTRARGATMYVTLEPCTHRGRTGPCVPAIVAAGIARMIVAMQDPDTRVNGRGIEQLRRAGLKVEVGDGAALARALNRAYIKQRTTGRPFVTLKIAQTQDGFVARRKGARTAITGKQAARFTRDERIEHDAVMIGVDTAIIDDPQLTVRPPHARAVPYTRIIVDSRGRLPLRAKLVRDRRAHTIVATTRAIPRRIRAALHRRGIEVLVCKRTADGRVDLRDLLASLGKQGMLSVLCEAGPKLARGLLTARCVDAIHWLIAPTKFGSTPAAAQAAVAAPVVRGAHVSEVRRIGRDVLVIAEMEVRASSRGSSNRRASSAKLRTNRARANSPSKTPR
jgi:diaminohydroxyphosphoribosylaminopyrimidine deaminase/5-amino-6-(5-phosphoribosylamino)uracil reductase